MVVTIILPILKANNFRMIAKSQQLASATILNSVLRKIVFFKGNKHIRRKRCIKMSVLGETSEFTVVYFINRLLIRLKKISALGKTLSENKRIWWRHLAKLRRVKNET